jgi:predicted nucleic acid-binding protein
VNPPVIVPDASVLLKWSLDSSDEKDREKALVLRSLWLAGRLRIVLPSLWIYEVGNILGLKQPDLARNLLQIYVGYQFDEERAADLLGTALDIMKAAGATFYDAAYHSVALKLNGTYVTADGKYARKAMPVGHVVALKDWRATSE